MMFFMVSEKQRSKKKWLSIVAKGEFNNVKLGESLVATPQHLLNKYLKINLMTLTNDPKKQGITVRFAVKNVDGNTGVAELVGYQMNTSHIKRLVRKAIKRIDDSFILKTKDNVSYEVKPLLIARHKTTQSVATTIRKRVRELLQNSFQNMTSEDVFMYVITNKLQMDVKNDVRKIYPLAISEIRVLKRLS